MSWHHMNYCKYNLFLQKLVCYAHCTSIMSTLCLLDMLVHFQVYGPNSTCCVATWHDQRPPQSTLWRRPWTRVVRVALVVMSVSRHAVRQARHISSRLPCANMHWRSYAFSLEMTPGFDADPWSSNLEMHRHCHPCVKSHNRHKFRVVQKFPIFVTTLTF